MPASEIERGAWPAPEVRRLHVDAGSGPWVKVVGTSDLVTAFRGLSAVFPEALDVFIDTGIDPRSSHGARAYLDHPTVARALHWLDDQHDRRPTPRDTTPDLPDIRLSDALLSVIVGSQYALRLEQAQGSGNQRARFAKQEASSSRT